MTKNETIIQMALEMLFDANEKGISNYKIAKDTEITEASIGNYVNKKTKPSPAHAKTLINYFKGNTQNTNNVNKSVVFSNIGGNVDNSRDKQEINGINPTSHASVHIHHDEGKDMVIKEQNKEVSVSLSILLNQLKNFCGQLERKDDFIINLTNESREINRENLKRHDANTERLEKLIQMIDEQNKRTQTRADRLIDVLVSKINVAVDVDKKTDKQ